MTHQTQTILTPLQLEKPSTANTLRANLLTLSASPLPLHKMYIQSYSNQLTPMPFALLPCEQPGQQDPLALMLTNGDACALPLKVHLSTYVSQSPWWQKGSVLHMWTQNFFTSPCLPPDRPGQTSWCSPNRHRRYRQTNNSQSNTLHCTTGCAGYFQLHPAMWWANFWDRGSRPCCTICLCIGRK